MVVLFVYHRKVSKSTPEFLIETNVSNQDQDRAFCSKCGAEANVQEVVSLLRVAKDEIVKAQQMALTGMASVPL